MALIPQVLIQFARQTYARHAIVNAASFSLDPVASCKLAARQCLCMEIVGELQPESK